MRYLLLAVGLLFGAAPAFAQVQPSSGMRTNGANATAAALGGIATRATGCNDVNKFVTGTGTCAAISGAAMAPDGSNATPAAMGNIAAVGNTVPSFVNSIILGGVLSAPVLGTTAGGQIGATTTTGTGNAVLAAAPTVNGLTNGLGTGQALLNIDGGSSGSGNGPAIYFKEGGSTKLAVGAYSAINGGAFDDTLTLQNLNGGGKVRVAGSSGGFQVDGGPIIAGTTTSTPVHQRTGQTTAPALTSCGGGSPAITGTDTAGIVTMGTTATGCVITFNVAYVSAPYCVVSWIATPLASQSYATSNTAITLTQTSTSGNKVQYICMAQAGG